MRALLITRAEDSSSGAIFLWRSLVQFYVCENEEVKCTKSKKERVTDSSTNKQAPEGHIISCESGLIINWAIACTIDLICLRSKNTKAITIS